ncbi:EAL domain-containing protein [Fodinisporobacter ferrooxydans]|uniref:EAL domain-containing protein n=1 Tax=Fodinisporobacter ferrooxydans TaxID=2901836 RepID=A0ABY4CNA7_9BACL|nr:EAL domain-containing protein [Alicyclobacillaceae bacterium MYW30-H2]
MSIKLKLTLVFSIIVSVILILNNTLHYATARDQLKDEQLKQIKVLAEQISDSIEHYKLGSKKIEEVLGDQLRIAAIAAKNQLNPDYHKVTNEQLKALSKEIGASHITLFAKQGDDIVGVRSSDPKELDLSTKKWGYWFTALQELLQTHEVRSVNKGQSLPHYWSGPMAISSSDPNHIDKYGYYYDGSTNYIINPYLQDEQVKQFEQYTGPDSAVQKIVKTHPWFLEITGFNPKVLGKTPIPITPNNIEYVKLEDRPIYFGQHKYYNPKTDVVDVQNAMSTGQVVSHEETIDGKHVIKTFIPIQDNSPYVIGFVTDYQVLNDVLQKQLKNDIWISIGILVIVLIASYFLSRYIVRPVHQLLHQVDQIAEGKFDIRISSIRKDELGKLANHVDIMSEKLEKYTKQLQENHEHMYFQAHHDTLTGLPNRLFFGEQLQELFFQKNSESFAIMYLDLDRFKNINDTLGHTIGDQLLIQVAERVKNSLLNRATIHRIGGDEFTILIDRPEKNETQEVAQSILNLFAQPFVLAESEFYITASIGISLYPENGSDIETLLKHADSAMYAAKQNGGNRYKLYDAKIEFETAERVVLENYLRKAIKQDEFFLQYQPKVDLKTKQITGVEALLRWEHPKLGTVSPNKFIPVAEEIGLIGTIGEWVLRSACVQNKVWQEEGLPPLRVAVNLSLYQFREDNLVQKIKDILMETGLDPTYLELEITESMSMYNEDYVVEKLSELRRIGIHISVDDFGTGYSSLNYLNKLPIDTLKIDRSFMKEDNKTTIKSIIGLAHNLNLKVIAEGVETSEQVDFLQQNGCDEAQGYFFDKPLSTIRLTKKLRELCGV